MSDSRVIEPDACGVDNNDPMKRLCDARYFDLRTTVKNIEGYAKQTAESVDRLTKCVEAHDDELRGGHGPQGGTGIRGAILDLQHGYRELQKRGVNWGALVTTIIVTVLSMVLGGVILALVLGVLKHGDKLAG